MIMVNLFYSDPYFHNPSLKASIAKGQPLNSIDDFTPDMIQNMVEEFVEVY